MAGKQGGRAQVEKSAGRESACGVLLVDKQAGITSHDAVAAVRRMSALGRAGHAGTLDPFASGLLLILVGKATRFFDLLAPLVKKYEVEAQFGARSTTGDVTGEITPVPGAVTRDEVMGVLPCFTGRMIQRVPAYSAVRRGGTRLYKLARQGKPVTPPLRQVVVHSLELESFEEDGQRARLAVTCAGGTYIRSLVEDIGGALGSAAYAAALRRAAIGKFRAEDAAPLRRLASLPPAQLFGRHNPSFLSPVSALYFLPVRELDASEIQAVRDGRFLTGNETGPVLLISAGDALAVYRGALAAQRLRDQELISAGDALAVYRPAGGGLIRPQVILT